MNRVLNRVQRCLVVAAALMVFVPAASGGSPTDEVEPDLAALVLMLDGEYRTAEPEKRGPEEPLLCDRRVRVKAPQIGEYVVYMQINRGEEKRLYRQVLMVFDESPDGGISQSSWRINDAARFADQFDNDGLFAALTKDDVKPVMAEEGCVQLWRRMDDGWYGYTNPDTCRIWSERRQTFRRIESETTILPDGLLRAERGFDDDGNQAFGTKPGETFRLARVSEPDQNQQTD